MKKYLYVLIIGFGIFLLPHFSHAAVYDTLTYDASKSSSLCEANSPCYMYDTVVGNYASGTYYVILPSPADSFQGWTQQAGTFISLGNGIYQLNATGNMSANMPTAVTFQPISCTGGDYAYDGACNVYEGNTVIVYTTMPTIAPTISFLFPTQSTSTGDFNAWATTINYATTTDAYKIVIQYATTPTYLPGINLFQDVAQWNFGVSNGIVPKANSLINQYQTSSVWYATANLYDQSEGGILVATSSQISFTVLNNGIFSIVTGSGISTSTSLNLYPGSTGIAPYPTSTYNCVAPTSSLFSPDIGGALAYGLCEAINFAFNPNIIPADPNYLNIEIQNLETKPPFVAFFGLANDVTSSTNSGGMNSVNIGILGYNSDNIATQTNLVTLNSSTFNLGTGTSQHSSYPTSNALGFLEPYISAFLWIGAGIKILVVFTQKQ